MSQRCRNRGESRRITFRLDRATGAQSLFVARLVVVVIEMFFSMRRWPSVSQNLAARTYRDQAAITTGRFAVVHRAIEVALFLLLRAVAAGPNKKRNRVTARPSSTPAAGIRASAHGRLSQKTFRAKGDARAERVRRLVPSGLRPASQQDGLALGKHFEAFQRFLMPFMHPVWEQQFSYLRNKTVLGFFSDNCAARDSRHNQPSVISANAQ